MKTRTIFASLAVLLTLSVSCKKNDDPAANSACTQANITAKADAYTAAVNTYVSAPTSANCKAVITSYDAYLAVAQNCSFVTQAQLASIQQARADLAKACP